MLTFSLKRTFPEDRKPGTSFIYAGSGRFQKTLSLYRWYKCWCSVLFCLLIFYPVFTRVHGILGTIRFCLFSIPVLLTNCTQKACTRKLFQGQGTGFFFCSANCIYNLQKRLTVSNGGFDEKSLKPPCKYFNHML